MRIELRLTDANFPMARQCDLSGLNFKDSISAVATQTSNMYCRPVADGHSNITSLFPKAIRGRLYCSTWNLGLTAHETAVALVSRRFCAMKKKSREKSTRGRGSVLPISQDICMRPGR